MRVRSVLGSLMIGAILALSPVRPVHGQGLEPGDSCEALDDFCDWLRPCPQGQECRLDVGDCGTNFFGTFPECGITHACLPKCFAPEADAYDGRRATPGSLR
jgi:hypothetical protein